MSAESIRMAAEGWRIISRFDDPRQSARQLLRWLAETFDLSAAGMVYRDEEAGYGWHEHVGRVVPGPRQSDSWEHPFPAGSSRWILEGDAPKLASCENLLDLLADQWLKTSELRISARQADPRTPEELRTPSWTALSRGARIVQSRLNSLALSPAPLLIIGEQGSGRSHLARLIHASSADPASPFCTPEEPGTEGTLFVVDWTDRSTENRATWLRDRRRLIATAQIRPSPSRNSSDGLRDLWRKSTDGAGRTLKVPALRDRKEDIPALAGIFLDEITAPLSSGSPGISAAALDALKSYAWPGNARELKDVMVRSFGRIGASGGQLLLEHLPPELRGFGTAAGNSTFPEKLVALEYEALKRELIRQRGNMTRTARALGLTPRQVSWRVRKYGIDPREFKPHLQSKA